MQADVFSVSLQQKTQISFPLLEKGPFYYIEKTSKLGLPPAEFCQVEKQPSYSLKYYNGQHDQTDEEILKNQNHLLSVDNILYVLSEDGKLRAYNMTFQDEIDAFSDIVNYNHVNEIMLDHRLVSELTQKNYVKLLFCEIYYVLVIVSKSIVISMSLDFQTIRTWMKPQTLNITEHEQIVRADIIKTKFYILRAFNTLDVWNIISANNIVKVGTYNFTKEINTLNLNSKINVTDFDVNENYLAIIEKNSKKMFIFDDEEFDENVASNLIYEGGFQQEPLILFFFANKFIVLVDASPYYKYSLQEYELFESKEVRPLRSTQLSNNLKDIVVGDIYVMVSYDDHIEVFPHFFIDPLSTNKIMKYSENIQNIGDIEYFQMLSTSKKNESEYFTVMKNGVITILKVIELPGKMACYPTENDNPGTYFDYLLFYEINCEKLNQYCNSSDIIKKPQIYQIIIEENANIISYSNNSLIAGLAAGLSCGFLLTALFCCCHLKSVHKKYQKLEKALDPAKPPERIMSQDDFNNAIQGKVENI